MSLVLVEMELKSHNAVGIIVMFAKYGFPKSLARTKGGREVDHLKTSSKDMNLKLVTEYPLMNTMKVLERPLSIRRPSQLNEEEDESYSFNVDGDKGGDESKTRKNTSFTRATNYKTRAGCIFPSLLLIIALFFLIFYYLPPYRNLVCGSDPLSRTQFLGYGDLETDFGSLGVPWCRSKHRKTVEWTSKDLLRALEDFVPIYETRPIKSNMYGMGFDHSFGLWFMTRWLKPLLMIESGAYKGHSTWILRKAIPDRPIITISPRHPGKYLKKGPAYVDGNCTYYSGKNFRDFGSIDWKSVVRKYGISDMSRVLVFFDDHQNELKRLKQAFKAGFKHLVFEDNYDTGTGDHYSLRQICDQFYIRGGGHSCFEDGDEARMRSRRKKIWEKGVEIEQLCGPGGAWWGVAGQMRDNFNHSNKVISFDQHFQNSRIVESVLDLYWELPPVAGPSLTHQTRYDPGRVSTPLVEDGMYRLFKKLGLTRLESSVFNGYTQMAYIQLSKP